MAVRAALLALLTLLSIRPAAAQVSPSQYSGRTIADVRVLIERRPSEEAALLGLIETRPGEPLSLAAVRESITHLFSLGRFQDVQVDAVDAANGAVALSYNLVPLHTVERVDFRGRLELSEGLLRRTMTERFGATPPVGRAAEVGRVLEQVYDDRGYFNATVRPVSTELHDPDRTLLAFEIDAGPRVRIGDIEVLGDAQATRADLLNRLDIAPGRPYERVELQERLSAYQQRLTERRFYQASASHDARLSPDGTVADLTIEIESGPVVDVVYAGDPLPEKTLKELVPIEREHSVDEDLREDSAERVREYLRQQGYWKAEVAVTRQESPGRLSIVFTVRKGLLYRVADGGDGIEVTGNRTIPVEELRPLFALAPGDVYVASRLDATLGAIRQLYLTRGYAWVSVKAGENELEPARPGEGLVRPAIVVTEGPRAVIGAIAIEGVEKLGEGRIRSVIETRPGTPFYRPQLAADRDAILLEYANEGFTSAAVTVTPAESDDRSRVELTFDIEEGPQTLVGHIIVVGNTRSDEQIIRRELRLRTGEPLGLQRVIDSRRNLGALGLFRRVSITPLEHGPSTSRDVLVTVEESAATTIGYGGGLEILRVLRATGPAGEPEERVEFAPRGFFEIGRRNLGGKNRSVNLFTRVSLRPENAPDDPERDGQGFGFSDYRLVGTFREPRPLGWAAELLLTGAAEQGARTGFNFTRKGVTAELLRRLTTSIRTSYRYSFSTTRTFNVTLDEEDQATIDRLFPQVRLSAFSGALARDTRDDLADPSRGTFLSGEGSLAAQSFGGQVGFMKTYLQSHFFTRLPGERRVVFATRAAVGLADGFAREAPDENGNLVVIEDLPASERFFAGGDTTIRGFALDTVGADNTISEQGFPRGGNAVLIMNAELRVPVWGDLGAALFVDGGNVFARVTQFDIGNLRGSLGFGVRYRSPIGPVRVDLGFKMDRREDRGESRSVLHFSIGQAF